MMAEVKRYPIQFPHVGGCCQERTSESSVTGYRAYIEMWTPEPDSLKIDDEKRGKLIGA